MIRSQTRTACVVGLFFFVGTPISEAIASGCSAHYQAGNAPIFSNEKLSNKSRELCYTAFVVMHSGLTRTPLWVAEHLTREHLQQARRLNRVNNFHADSQLPESERAELNDYVRSGYDRGHLAPSANMPTEDAQYESFTLANMIPQEPSVNRGIWEAMESTMRQWASQKGEVYIVSGVMFQGAQIQRLNRRVMIPTHVYKAVYDPSTQGAAAYVVENKPTSDYSIISMAELEKMAGVDVFPALSAHQKQHKMDLPVPKSTHGGMSGTKKPSPTKEDISWIKQLLSHFLSKL